MHKCTPIIVFIGAMIMTSTGWGQDKSDAMKKSDSEIARLEAKANEGDGAAAYELYSIYAFGEKDYDKAYIWIKRAAELGEPRGCKDFVMMKKHEDVIPDICSGKEQPPGAQ